MSQRSKGNRFFAFFLEPKVQKLTARVDVAGLCKALSYPKNFETRLLAAEALAQLRAPESVQSLLTALGDPEHQVRSAVKDALTEIIDTVPIKDLFAIFKSDSHPAQFMVGDLLLLKEEKPPVEEVILMLDHTDQFIRRQAARILADIGTVETLEPLRKVANNIESYKTGESYYEKNVFLEVALANAMGEIGGESAIEVLVGLLDFEHFQVKEAAIRALFTIGPTLAFDPLMHLLEIEDERFFQVASTGVLAASQDTRFIEPLIDHLLNDKSVGYVKKILVHMGIEVAPKLVSALEVNLDYFVTAGIVQLLAQIGDTRAIKPLVTMLTEPDSPKYAILDTLVKLGWQPQSGQEKCWYQAAQKRWEDLELNADEAIPILASLLHDYDIVMQDFQDIPHRSRHGSFWSLAHYDAAQEAAILFARIGDKDAQEALWNAVKGIEGPFSHHVAGLAETALMATGDKKYAGYFLDEFIKKGVVTHYDCREERPHSTPPSHVKKCFGDYAENIYNSVHRFAEHLPEADDMDAATRYYIGNNQIEAVQNLCKLITHMSSNILTKFVLHRDKEGHFASSVDLAKKELVTRGYPKHDPSLYDKEASWRIGP